MIERWRIGLVYLAVEGSSIQASQESPASLQRPSHLRLPPGDSNPVQGEPRGLGHLRMKGKTSGDEGQAHSHS